MSEQVKVVNSGGIGFCALLAVLFIGLKLTGYVVWPWLWVLAPLWIPFAILTAIMLVTLIVILFVTIAEACRK